MEHRWIWPRPGRLSAIALTITRMEVRNPRNVLSGLEKARRYGYATFDPTATYSPDQA